MDERTAQVHDHIAALLGDAERERLAHASALQRTPRATSTAPGRALRRRAGRALMALGAFVEGPAAMDCDTCPDGAVAAGGA